MMTKVTLPYRSQEQDRVCQNVFCVFALGLALPNKLNNTVVRIEGVT